MRLRFLPIAALLSGIVTASCKGHPPPEDTDAELFRTPEALTGARELNLAKWISDFRRASGHLPQSTQQLPLPTPSTNPTENPLNDGWGHPIILEPVGKGFELRSFGPDGIRGTQDDIVHRVDDPAMVSLATSAVSQLARSGTTGSPDLIPRDGCLASLNDGPHEAQGVSGLG